MMPGLVVFKRRWTAGSDDLVLPGFLLFLLHLILFIVTSVYLSYYSDYAKWASFDPESIKRLNADDATVILVHCVKNARTYSFVFVALLVTALLLEGVMVVFSMQGTISNPTPRQPVKYVIYARSILGLTEVIFSIVVASRLTWHLASCEKIHHLFVVQAVIVALNFMLLLIVLLVVCCVYDSTGYSFYKMKKAEEHPSLLSSTHMNHLRMEFDETLRQSWYASLRRCCCCARDSQNTQVALEEVSHLLRDFFKDLDVVPSDILAGLILLRHKQQCLESNKVLSDSEIEEFLSGRPVTSSTIYCDPSDPAISQRYDDMIYYCNYAIASYGPLFYFVYNPGTGLCKLTHQCLSAKLSHGQFSSTVIEDDNCCHWQSSAVLRSLKGNVDNTDMVYFSWNNDLYKQPFFVCVDHDKKAVVVTVRGTLSDMDAVTDMVATAVPIPGQGLDGSWKAHKGIMKGALYLKEKLLNETILSQAFEHGRSRGTGDYKLVLVGHSLGAGVAAILAIILRPVYPGLICFSYSPPGGLLSLAAMKGSKSYINTAVFGKDLVIRTGLSQLQKMRNGTVDLLKRTTLPKYRIIFGNLFRATEDRHCLFTDGLPHGGDVERSSGDLSRDSDDVMACEDLYPPGKILHIVYRKSKSGSSCFARSSENTSYYAIEADNENDFNEILVSHNMVKHHWPQELQKAMKKVLQTSMDAELSKKYSKSATIPSDAPLPHHQSSERTSLLNGKEASQPPDILKETLIHNQHSQTDVESEIRCRSSVDASVHLVSETRPEHNSSSPLASSSVEIALMEQTVNEAQDPEQFANTNENNNTLAANDFNNTNGGIEQEKETSSRASSRDATDAIADTGTPSPSAAASKAESSPPSHMANQLGSYIDADLRNPCDGCKDGNLLSEPTPDSKYSRSQSVPARGNASSSATLDNEVKKRAQFEPNLIPKPPRSNSTSSKRRPTHLPVNRRKDYASAPPSRTTTPSATGHVIIEKNLTP